MKTQVNSETLASKLALAARSYTPERKKKGRMSKFAQHVDTIRYLRCQRHMSYLEITKFFNENGLPCTYPTLRHFVKNNKIGK